MKMEIKKVGKKVLINHTGVFFEFSVDKYDYIKYLVPILKMLRNLHLKHTSIEIKVKDISKVSNKDLFEAVINTPKKLEELEERLKSYEHKLDVDYKEVDDLDLSLIDKKVYKANLELMRDYQIQRKINKAVYHLAIDEARDLMLRKEVTKMMTDANTDFLHILHSLKNDIRAIRTSLAIEVYMFEKNDKKFLLLNNPSFL